MIRLVVVNIVIGLLCGCDRGGSPKPKAAAAFKISVLASAYPLSDMMKRVGGDWVEVQWLAESGQRPEAIQVGPELRRRAGKSTLVVTSGPWDAWASSELNAEARSARLIEPERTTAGRQADSTAYLWLDPAIVREMIDMARIRLMIIDPTHEADYRKNADSYRDEVDAVDKELRDGLRKFAGRPVLAVRPVWGALCKRYGLPLVTPVEVTEEKLTPADFKEIARTAKAAGIKTLFIDGATSVAVRQQIEEKTGLKTVTLDALGDSAADGRNTWAKVLRFDLAQLRKGLE